jgi:hypothetical protein
MVTGADHVEPARSGELGDEASDGAVGGVLHEPFALAQVEGVEQGDGAERHRDELRGDLVAERIVDRDEGRGLGHEVLGPDAEGAAGGHALADREVRDIRTDGVDDADRLGSGAGGQFGLEAVGAPDRPQVVVVDGAEEGAHAHLAGAGLGRRDLFDGEDVGGLSELVVDDGAHGGLDFLSFFGW